MDLKHINPQLDDIIQLRAQFGLRSCANTLARMLNPSNATNRLTHRHASLVFPGGKVVCYNGCLCNLLIRHKLQHYVSR